MCAFYQRIQSRRGIQFAIVTTAQHRRTITGFSTVVRDVHAALVLLEHSRGWQR
ncbi:hypothetical protein ABZX77_43720 [Streptomyces sp. NPDC004237]|uniref:hypothetical protein n=1 Tax=Streptomyces sp. NPDC004237 TaxID=3154455 RepID=UPI0033B8F05D